ncbi:MAG: anthranilate phosphoribosyltransferase [Planctomycetota bacterium]|nr:anthranilate phosphoribosyltransferase [Planctomycetota bacterium]
MTSTPPFGSAQGTLGHLLSGDTLSAEQAEALFEALLTGGLDDAQIAGILALIQARDVTVDEIVGAARVMRRHVTPVPRPFDTDDAVLIDTCGTGGAPKTFNVSTAAAIVAAAASTGTPRVLVAKHGNRSRTGRGSAEVLEALGVNVAASPEVQSRCLGEAGVCFCFAIHHHPAMKHAIGPRRSLGFPTIFNILGPLTNPAGADRQLIGVYDARFLPLLGEALVRLGATRAIIAHAADGLDELSTTAPTHLVHVEHGTTREQTIDPAALGLAPATLADLQATDVEDSARIIRDVLDGTPGPHREMVLLNAAAAIVVAGITDDLATALALATEAIDKGRAAATLDTLTRVSHIS